MNRGTNLNCYWLISIILGTLISHLNFLYLSVKKQGVRSGLNEVNWYFQGLKKMVKYLWGRVV